MQFTKLGSSGVQVSRIALGMGFRGQRDEAEILNVVARALDAGVTFFDCANIYGPGDDRALAGRSEVLLGKALGGRRDELVITSKFSGAVGAGVNDRGGSRYHIVREVERSLKRLGTDRIDVYLMHSPDPETPLEETVATLDLLVRQGKILYWGLSNYSAWEACQALWVADAGGWQMPAVLQNPYSLLNRKLESDLFEFARRFGLGVMAYSPLAIGLLAGTYSEEGGAEAGALWRDRLGDRLGEVLTDEVRRVKGEVDRIGKERKVTPAEVSIAWVLGNKAVSVAIAGPDRPEHLDDYVNAVGLSLEEGELNALAGASQATGSLIGEWQLPRV